MIVKRVPYTMLHETAKYLQFKTVSFITSKSDRNLAAAFYLRPTTEHNKYLLYKIHYGSRIIPANLVDDEKVEHFIDYAPQYNICRHGHQAFILDIYKHVPDAEVTTGFGTFSSAEEFMRQDLLAYKAHQPNPTLTCNCERNCKSKESGTWRPAHIPSYVGKWDWWEGKK